MRTPLNYSVNRVAREAANNYARGRKRGRPPEPDGYGCFIWILGAIVIYIALRIFR